ncbi:hypothetical protein ACXYTJ_00860 [Gilvimarinus sp. F26214L]|uniref:hypothetical protein n=1 Tax=Gilvimarinus sp. DZF01 TaxID=3461371 RepID=UPI004046863E
MRFLKDPVRRLFLTVGLEVKRIEDKPDPAPVYEDFLEVCRRRNYGEPVAFRCPISKIVTVNGFSFHRSGSWHPFTEAMQEYMDSDYRQSYGGSTLEDFYRVWQPQNSLEALIGANGPAVLVDYPAYAMHSPWLDISPDERQVYMKQMIHLENCWSGAEDVHANEGYGLHGPVSPRKGQIEYNRLVRTLRSVVLRGYDRRLSGEDVTVVAVERGGDYRCCIAHGQHRVAVLAALGYQFIPVIINKVARVSEAAHWTQVYRGTWTEEQARTYVNHLFTFDGYRWAAERGLVRQQSTVEDPRPAAVL